MRLSIQTTEGEQLVDPSEVSWVVAIEEADLHPLPQGGCVGMARGVPVVVLGDLEGARWLVLLQPNGDLYPARPALGIDWCSS